MINSMRGATNDSLAGLTDVACANLAGLADEKEVDNMNDLVEQKLKKLHYFPPNFRVQAPHSIVAAHPLLAGIPKKAFRSEVCRSPFLCS